MEKTQTISVLLTCHNRRDKTLDCLQSLFKASLPENYFMDVFLVDDGSTDGTSEAVKIQFPKVNVIQGNGKLFWNRGMRLAWETAAKTKDYDYYLWLNDDTLIFPEALNILLQKAQTTKRKQILVGATCFNDLTDITYGGFLYYMTSLVPNKEWQVCDFFNGNIVLIPAFVFKSIGLLDIRFRHAYGDFDYGMRATKMGFSHLLSPKPLGYCECHVSDPTWINAKVPLFKRLLHLYTPLGNNPIELFVFEKRHNGFYLAIVHFISVHLRAILPKLWQRAYFLNYQAEKRISTNIHPNLGQKDNRYC